jgi:hypothetical protein
VASAAVRLVCSQWKVNHDAVVKRLVLRVPTTDEGMGILARRFPAISSVEVKWDGGKACPMTDEGTLAVSKLRALTSLDLTWCTKVADEGMLE